MADSTTKILTTVLFLALISQGYSQCLLSDISVRQAQTGAKVLGKPEWGVTITNKCPCMQRNVKLNCLQFQTTEHIDPSVLRINGSVCLVSNGEPIYENKVTFKYAWDESFPLNPIFSDIMCS